MSIPWPGRSGIIFDIPLNLPPICDLPCTIFVILLRCLVLFPFIGLGFLPIPPHPFFFSSPSLFSPLSCLSTHDYCVFNMLPGLIYACLVITKYLLCKYPWEGFTVVLDVDNISRWISSKVFYVADISILLKLHSMQLLDDHLCPPY